MEPIGIFRFSCKFPSCKNKYYSPIFDPHYVNKKFHKFPRNPLSQEMWKQICNIKASTNCTNFLVCEDHFEMKDYSNLSFKGRLINYSTIFPKPSSDSIMNGSHCAVYGCLSVITSINKCTFPNPITEFDLFNQWVSFCNNKVLSDKTDAQIYDNCKICINHFETSYCDNTGEFNHKTFPTLQPTDCLKKQNITSDHDYHIPANQSNESGTSSLTSANGAVLKDISNISTSDLETLNNNLLRKIPRSQLLDTDSTSDICLSPITEVEYLQQYCVTCFSTYSDKYFQISHRCESNRTIREIIILLVPKMDKVLLENHKICSECKKSLDICMQFVNQCNFVYSQLEGDNVEKYKDLNIIKNLSKEGQSEYENVKCKNVDTERVQERHKDIDDTKEMPTLLNGDLDEESNEEFDNTKEMSTLNSNFDGETNGEIITLGASDFDEDSNGEVENPKDIITINPDEESNGETDNTKEMPKSTNRNSLISNDETVGKKLNVPERVVAVSQPNVDVLRRLLNYFSTSGIFIKNESNELIDSGPKRILLFGVRMYPKKFRDKSFYNWNKVVNNTPVDCDKCLTTFKNRIGLRHHLKHSHSASVKCTSCNLSFCTARALAKHRTFHNEYVKLKEFLCDICGKHFNSAQSFVRHKQKHKSQQCICEDYSNCVCDADNRNAVDSSIIVPELKTVGYICEVCGKYCSTSTQFSHHKTTHENRRIFCELCGDFYKPKDSRHKLKHAFHEKTFKCDQCSKKFWTVKNLKVHISKNHVGDESENYAQCEECGKVYKTIRILKKHMSTVHSNFSLPCPQCPKKFASKYNLNKHINCIHNNVKRKKYPKGESTFRKKSSFVKLTAPIKNELLPCRICGKYLKGITNLRMHLKCHIPTKRYPCTKCGLTLKNTNTLKKHLLTHQINEENQYRCDVCWKRYELREELECHMKTHKTPKYACPHCDNAFYRKFLLDNHLVNEHSTPEQLKSTFTDVINETISMLNAGQDIETNCFENEIIAGQDIETNCFENEIEISISNEDEEAANILLNCFPNES